MVGELDDAGSPVGRIRHEQEIAAGFHVAKQVVDGLLGDLELLGELGRTQAFGGRIAEHADVEATEIVEPRGCRPAWT